jgi:ComF family protein
LSILTGNFLNICAKLWRSLPAQPCLLCGAFSREGAWCAACDAALPYLTARHCPRCALPTPGGELCGRCLKRAPQFDRAAAVFTYAFPLDKLIHALKYGEKLVLANSFADKLSARMTVRPDCLIAMPLHPSRLCERGFNQSLELARRVANRLHVPLLPHACERVRATLPQSTLKWKERDKNVRRAFACTREVEGKHVAVIDDVMTSGASLNQVAIALRAAGAREISVCVVARALPYI